MSKSGSAKMDYARLKTLIDTFNDAKKLFNDKKYSEANQLLQKGLEGFNAIRTPDKTNYDSLSAPEVYLSMIELQKKISKKQQSLGLDLDNQVTYKCPVIEEKKDLKKIQPDASIPEFGLLSGVQREKVELYTLYVLPLKYPTLFPQATHVLLYGPPGTGKTLIAQSLSKTINTYFVRLDQQEATWKQNVKSLWFNVNAADLKGAYVGQTEKNIRAVFDCANSLAISFSTDAISMVFIDEIDAIAASRGGGGDKDIKGGGGGGANTVTTLIQFMQGAVAYPRVSVIGATNEPWNLDSAILSRFATQIFVDVSGRNARYHLLLTEILKLKRIDEDDENGKKKIRKQRHNEKLDTYITLLEKFFDDDELEILKEITILTGMHWSAKDVLIKNFGKQRAMDIIETWKTYDREIPEKKGKKEKGWLSFLSKDEEEEPKEELEPKSVFGYTNRDIVNVAKELIRSSAYRQVTITRYPNLKTGKYCLLECPDEFEDCDECPFGTYSATDRFNLKINQQDMNHALDKVRGSIMDTVQYCNYLAYWKYQTSLQKLKALPVT